MTCIGTYGLVGQRLRLIIVADAPRELGPLEGAAYGAICLGILGAVIGLIRGLWVYPPTAWFAVFEAGVPAFLAGAVGGSVVGLAIRLVRGSSRSRKSRF